MVVVVISSSVVLASGFAWCFFLLLIVNRVYAYYDVSQAEVLLL